MPRRVSSGDASIALPFRLGPYELVSLLGRGGMGEVYRARDTRLNRTVAIKLLSPTLSDDPAARTRFHREARAIASLNHAHVCVVHDVGQEGPFQFIVMESIDGESLRVRLERGPLPPDEVLQRGIEIAEGLDHAHALGIVHRDIKPGNIMLTRGGAKLVDFGLAALRQSIFDEDTVEDRALTTPGQIMGTLHYMAPEQLEGKEIDAMTDLFGCGLVLYEMATGRRAYDGASSAAIIGAILTGPAPSIRDVGPTHSADLDWAIRRCLAKNPQDRWQSAADLAAVLRWIQTKSGTNAEVAASAAPPTRRWKRAAITASAVGAILLGTWMTARQRQDSPSAPAPQTRTSVRLVTDAVLAEDGIPAIAISPDGRRLTYTALVNRTSRLYVRRMDQLEATVVPGTEGASSPFFSPDGNSVAFFASGKLKRVALDGSSPVVLANAPRGRGGSWATADTIVFAPSTDTPLYRIPAAGGDAESVTTLGERPHERSHRWPEVLPGGRAVLFTSGTPTDAILSDAQIELQPLAGGKERRVLIEGATYARYADGHLLYFRNGALMAVPFDAERLQLTGTAVPVLDDVAWNSYVGSAQFAVSGGSVLYLRGAGASTYLTWIGRDGTVTRVDETKGPFVEPKLSPDGARIATAMDDAQADLAVYDLAARTLRRITHTPEFEGNPVWSPDGTRVVFASERGSGVQMFWKRWDDPRGDPSALVQSTAADEPLAPGEYARVPHDWSPDGRFVAFTENRPDTRRDIWIAPLNKEDKPYPFVVSPFNDTQPVFSPDGKWLAYQSNDLGSDTIYVRAFPASGGPIRVAPRDAHWPRWSRGGELFYWSGGRMYAVTISTANGTVNVAAPRPLFDINVGPPTPLFEISSRPSYDVTPDGRRFLVAQRDPAAKPAELILLHQWRAAMRR